MLGSDMCDSRVAECLSGTIGSIGKFVVCSEWGKKKCDV